jgi:hypothetical protein
MGSLANPLCIYRYSGRQWPKTFFPSRPLAVRVTRPSSLASRRHFHHRRFLKNPSFRVTHMDFMQQCYHSLTFPYPLLDRRSDKVLTPLVVPATVQAVAAWACIYDPPLTMARPRAISGPFVHIVWGNPFYFQGLLYAHQENIGF